MDLESLGNYYVWAEEEVRKVVKSLSDEEFSQKHEKIGRSVRDLIEHLWVSYESYFHPPTMDTWKKLAEEATNMSRSDLTEKWKEGCGKFAKGILEYDKGEVTFPIDKEKSLKLNKEDYFLLYTDHQTYHRGQLMTILKMLGKEGVNTDYFTFAMSNA
ncbi:MAG: DinB family protein [Candidatus Kariarchaeaceae archaeon]|jgi:uncharacterized damage-inducible protein DinB